MSLGNQEKWQRNWGRRECREPLPSSPQTQPRSQGGSRGSRLCRAQWALLPTSGNLITSGTSAPPDGGREPGAAFPVVIAFAPCSTDTRLPLHGWEGQGPECAGPLLLPLMLCGLLVPALSIA